MRCFVFLAFLLTSVSAFADALRSDKHVVKIEGSALQYNVQIFDAESRQHLAHVKLDAAKDGATAEAETSAGNVHYTIRIEPHGEAYLVDFTAHDGTEVIDRMRGGFTPGSRVKPPAPPRTTVRGEAKVLRRIDAVYTDEAKAAGAVGNVVVDVVIDKSGFVREATVLQPMGHGLSESALEAVKQWQFEATLQGRVPVEVVQEVTIAFKP